MFSVALFITSRCPAVNRHPALRSPDFPLRTCVRSDCLASFTSSLTCRLPVNGHLTAGVANFAARMVHHNLTLSSYGLNLRNYCQFNTIYLRHERFTHHWRQRTAALLAGKRIRFVHRLWQPVAFFRLALSRYGFLRDAGGAFQANLHRL